MLRGLAVLLLFQLVGESLIFLLGVSIPGPVAGLVLLFAALPALDRLWKQDVSSIDEAAETLLSNLGLFFVPAGVGVVALASILSAQIWALGAVLPKPVWRRGFELPVHAIQWTRGRLVRECRTDRLSSNDTLQAH